MSLFFRVRANAALVRKLRLEANLTQEQLAEKSDLSKKTIENIERSELVYRTSLVAVAVVLCVHVDILITSEPGAIRTAGHLLRAGNENQQSPRCWDPRRDSPKSVMEEMDKHLASSHEMIGVWPHLHVMIAPPEVQRYRVLAEAERLATRWERNTVSMTRTNVSTQAHKRYLDAGRSNAIRIVHIMLWSDWDKFCEGKWPYDRCPLSERLRCLDLLRQFEEKQGLQIKLISPQVCKAFPSVVSLARAFKARVVVGNRFATEIGHDERVVCHEDDDRVTGHKEVLSMLSDVACPCPMTAYEKWMKGGTRPKEKPQLSTWF